MTTQAVRKTRWVTYGLPLLLLLGLLLQACVPAAAPAAQESASEEAMEEAAGNVTVYGTELPADAKPYDEQVYRVAADINQSASTFDFPVAVYNRYCLADLFQDTLVSLDKDFNVIPGAAESWDVSEDGKVWSFHLRPGQVWSDGTPLTAYDYEATFRLTATPEHGWDFSWFYSFLADGGIKNWSKIIAGELPPEELGVRAVDDLTLEVETEDVFPPLPGVMKFAFTLQKKALEEHGPYYNSSLETSVSSGPFVLAEFDPGNKIVVEANPTYKGFRPPLIKRMECIFMDPSTFFAAYQNGDIDKVPYGALTPADFELILRDEEMAGNYLRHFGDFRTDYLLFDTFTEPFSDIHVRKAFAHAVDRENIVASVYGEIKAMPAYSMLMPGYPSSDTEGNLREYQNYDCDEANEHLAAAGYPGGEGFPDLVMMLRGEAPAMAAVYQAVAASITECLNINLEISNVDRKVYMDALNAKPTQLTFGAVDYGMDFLDPANLLGNVWKSGGRHSWKNDEFDALVTEAAGMVGNPELRDQMFRDAERVLVDDVGGIFIAHRWAGDLMQSWVQGTIRDADSQGITGWHWGNDQDISLIYITE
ncbi:MAG: peptide ABC transporter substrate-binding protein [Caldilineaceae bacterium]|nr:peptide ABC transporter substrate-binding protein [Caldilineaceae bacterium]MCY3992603.1 peptide ABC transporter substrate-binding protein [Caldilineaceae bacterium]MDE0076169.1 peptide ABC transporter substrate-binding protein [Caldilineaceae bacterium]